MGSQARNGHQQEEVLFVILSCVKRDLVEFVAQKWKYFWSSETVHLEK